MRFVIKIIKISCLFILLNGLAGHRVLAADDWVLKSDSYSLSRQMLEQTLQARGFGVDPATASTVLAAPQKTALLQELFIRESLLTQRDQVPAVALAGLEKKLQDYRRNQLARLTLDVLAETDMPDFLKRANELYSVRKQEHYRQPLRLRVRVLRKTIAQDQSRGKHGDREATIRSLQAVLASINSKENSEAVDFTQAVLQHSDAPKRKLTGGDSFWFQRGQQPDIIFTAAEKLSAAQPLSEVLVDEQYAYILQFIGRQEAREQSFAEVKDDLIKELQTEYRDEQRKQLLADLRNRFLYEVEVHPDFQ